MHFSMRVLRRITATLVFSWLAGSATAAPSTCEAGTYGQANQDIVVLESKDWIPFPALGYLILDGRYGSTASPKSPVICEAGSVLLLLENGQKVHLRKRAFKHSREKIPVAGAVLLGDLLEPKDVDSGNVRPLVVMVHGSETEPAIDNNRAYMLAAQGVLVFTYDKRGTGQSGGFYTQNFELLADDAAAAMRHAQTMAHGRFGRSGYWGQSQGGWVAPLAATRSQVDFVAVGFGLVASPIEEDRDQMLLEAQAMGLSEADKQKIRQLSNATAAIVSSHFTAGFEALEVLRAAFKGEKWSRSIEGEYSGDMLRMSDGDLRRVGRALFDNLELIWNYDPAPALQKLKTPLLWTIAEKDRAAPIDQTVMALQSFKKAGKPFEIFVFPDTDHGMYEFLQKTDGSRENTRVTNGYFKLIGDWVMGKAIGPYGRSRELPAANDRAPLRP